MRRGRGIERCDHQEKRERHILFSERPAKICENNGPGCVCPKGERKGGMRDKKKFSAEVRKGKKGPLILFRGGRPETVIAPDRYSVGEEKEGLIEGKGKKPVATTWRKLQPEKGNAAVGPASGKEKKRFGTRKDK